MKYLQRLLLFAISGLLGCSTYSFKTTVQPYKVFDLTNPSPSGSQAQHVFKDTRKGIFVTHNIEVQPYIWGREYKYKIHSSMSTCSPGATDCSPDVRSYKAEELISSRPMDHPIIYAQPLAPLCRIMETSSQPSVQKMEELFKASGTKLIVENKRALAKRIERECLSKVSPKSNLMLKLLPTGHVLLKKTEAKSPDYKVPRV